MNQTLKNWLEESQNIVFFGGAGVSTESGIPDFRSVDGLYSQSYAYPPETILSRCFFDTKPAEFYRFYREKMLYLDAKPNSAHLALAKLEAQGKLQAIITQNIDGLHQMAGSKRVFELHGSVHRNFCRRCKKSYPVEKIMSSTALPLCSCGGLIKPDVVLYQEGLNEETTNNALSALEKADVLIVGGTSLNVYPAAGLIEHYLGNKLVLINKSPTPMDHHANLLLPVAIGEELSGWL